MKTRRAGRLADRVQLHLARVKPSAWVYAIPCVTLALAVTTSCEKLDAHGTTEDTRVADTPPDDGDARDGDQTDAPRPAYDRTLADLGPVPDDCQADATAFSERANLRVFAVGQKLLLSEAESYATWRTSMHRLIHERVASCLASDRPNLVVMPEDIGFHALAIGSRGETARAADLSAVALVELLKAYTVPIGYYLDQFGGSSAVPAGRQVFLGATDTVWRAVDDTFSQLAASYGIWLSVTFNAPDARPQSDPALVETLADPDYQLPSSVWVADSPSVYNMQVLYGPDGTRHERATVRKVHLTRPEIELLRMTPGRLSQMVPFEVAGTLACAVISRDAWMPDVMQRVDDLGCELALQSEAFNGWAVAEVLPEFPAGWSPEVFMESSHFHVQRYASLRYNVTPALTGNFYDLVFDGQSHVVHDAREDDTPMAFVGNEKRRGFLAIGPWVVEDPIESDPDATLDARRAALQEVGAALAPGSGDPRENGYIRSVVATDVSVGATLRDDAEWHPASIAHPDGTGVLTVYAVGPAGARAIVARTTSSDGSSGAPVEIASDAAVDRYRPQLTKTGGGTVAIWQERDEAGEWLALSARDDESGRWSSPRRFLGPGLGGLDESTWPTRAAIAAEGDALVVAFVALTDGTARITTVRSDDGGASWSVPRELVPRGETLTDDELHQWGPAVTFVEPATGAGPESSAVVVAWLDRRAQDWIIYAAASIDGGRTFGASVRVDDARAGNERIHQDIALASLGEGSVRVAWSDLRHRRPDRDVAAVTVGVAVDGTVTVDRDAVETLAGEGDEPSNQMSPTLAMTASARWAGWVDDTDGPPGLRLARDAGEGFVPVTVAARSGEHVVEPQLVVGGDAAETVFAVTTRIAVDGGRRVAVDVVQ